MSDALKNISKSFARMKQRVFGQRKVAAMLGRADGQVVAGDGIVYATLKTGEVITVANAKVANRPYMKVWIGQDEHNPSTMQVLSERFVYGKPLTGSLPLHGDKHKWPKEDTVWVDGNQFVPLLAIPGATAYSVKLYGSTVKWIDGAQYVNILPTDLDLSSLVPTDGALYALLQVDDTGTLTAKTGTQVEAPELLGLADIPLPDAGQLELWAVRLYSGMDRVHKDEQVNDFVDLRWGRGGAGGSGSGDVVGPASAVDGNLASYDGMTGKLIKDSGIAAENVITDPETVVSTFIAYGPELITNGGFDADDTGWNVGTGWAWESDGGGGGWMRHTAGNTDPLSQDGTLVTDGYYYVQITIGGLTAGSVGVGLDDGQYQYNLTSASYLIMRYSADAGVKLFIIPTSDFDGYIDAVSITRPPMVQEAALDNQIYGRSGFGWYPLINANANTQNFTVTNSPYTANTLQDCTVIWDASGGACVQNLPAATNSGKIFYFKKVDSSANTVTVTPDGTDTIDGAASYVLSAQYESVTVQDCASGVWYVL